MAKKKKSRRKQSLVSKAANVGLLLLAFIRPITILMGPGSLQGKAEKIIWEATFGLVRGSQMGAFSLGAGLPMYAPAGAAFALGKIKGFAMRHFPVRG